MVVRTTTCLHAELLGPTGLLISSKERIKGKDKGRKVARQDK